MADSPFDRTIINLRERPLSSDINQAQSQLDRTLRDVLRRMLSASPANFALPDPNENVDTWAPEAIGDPANGGGVFGNSLFVAPSIGMTVTVRAGVGMQRRASDLVTAIGGIGGLDDLADLKPLYLSADQDIVVDAAPAPGNSRIDIIEVSADRRTDNPTSRDVLNVGTGVFEATGVDKTLAWDLLGRTGRVVSPSNSTTGIGYKVGAVAVTGAEVAPATSPGYTKVAEIRIAGGTVTIVANLINDTRRLMAPYDIFPFSFQGQWNGGGSPITAARVFAPPGVRGTLYRASAAQDVRLLLTALNGGTIQATVEPRNTGVVATRKITTAAWVLNGSGVQVTSTIQAEVADLTRTDNPLNLAIGQGVATLDFSLITISDIVTDPNIVSVAPSPVLLNGAGIVVLN